MMESKDFTKNLLFTLRTTAGKKERQNWLSWDLVVCEREPFSTKPLVKREDLPTKPFDDVWGEQKDA